MAVVFEDDGENGFTFTLDSEATGIIKHRQKKIWFKEGLQDQWRIALDGEGFQHTAGTAQEAQDWVEQELN